MRSSEFFKVEHGLLIIESLRESDIEAQRSEGKALSAALTLAGVSHWLHTVKTKDNLQNVFADYRELLSNRIHDRPSAPTLHVSAHGNESGFALTSGEFVSWSELRELMVQLAKDSGRLTARGVGLIGLNMSTCEGMNASRMFDIGPPYPCFGVLGPKRVIPWTDALVAYTTFYHQSITKDLQMPQAIVAMNAAALTDAFELVLPRDIGSILSPKGLTWMRRYEEVRKRGSCT